MSNFNEGNIASENKGVGTQKNLAKPANKKMSKNVDLQAKYDLAYRFQFKKKGPTNPDA